MAAFDSTFLIDFLRRRSHAVEKMAALEGDGEDLAVTHVSAMEVLAGASPLGGRRLDEAMRLLGSLELLPFDLPAALAAARVDAELAAAGKPIGIADTLIAGIVLRHGERLLTRDQGFARVRGLRVERY